MSELVGQKLAHFRIQEKLGQGGMGVVYRALDEKLRREVALKVLPFVAGSGEHKMRRFLREARSAAAATHPCIAAVHEIGEADGYAFIAMELIAGTTLRTRLEMGLAQGESVRIARDIARGLAKAHESGVVHRDLKPENVMLTRDGDVKILDFGLAKLRTTQASDYPPPSQGGETMREVTARGEVMGTVPYMSPEQARGEDADARSDIFSFGTMFYEMLSGTRPFQGGSVFAVLFAVTHEQPKPLVEVNPDVPDDLAKVVARCHEKDRAARYSSGRELCSALEDCVSHELSRRGSGTMPRVSVLPAKLVSVQGLGLELASTLAPGASGKPPEPSETPRASKRRTGALAAVGVVAVASLAALFGREALRPKRPVATATASTDVPAPAASTAQALAVFTQANQALRDGDPDLAMAEWERAAKLDPDLCPAHLRIAANQDSPNVRAREELEKVRRCEQRLSPHDRAFEGVVAAFVDPSVKTADKVAIATRAANAFPESAELAFFLANYLSSDANDPVLALAWDDRTLAIDPGFASAHVRRSEQLLYLGRADDAHQALDDCFAHTADAPVCAAARFNAITREGHCEAADTYVRGLIARRPSAPYAYDMLARLLIGTGASMEAILRVEQQADALRPAEDAPSESMKLRRQRQACVVHGDFTCALEAIRQAEQLETARVDASTPWQSAFQAARAYREIGQPEAAREVVSRFFDRLPSFERNDEWTISDSIDAHQMAYELGILPRAALDVAGEQSLASMPIADAFNRWAMVRLSPDPTLQEAKEDLAVAPPLSVLEERRPTILDVPNRAFRVGIAFLKTGSPAVARPWLEQAVKACVWDWRTEPVIPDLFDVPRVHALLAVGEARERTGDQDGARDAYREVLRRWGDAKPKSVTADQARARLAVLGK